MCSGPGLGLKVQWIKVLEHFNQEEATNKGLLTSEEYLAIFYFCFNAAPKILRPMLKWSREQFLEKAKSLARERLERVRARSLAGEN